MSLMGSQESYEAMHTVAKPALAALIAHKRELDEDGLPSHPVLQDDAEHLEQGNDADVRSDQPADAPSDEVSSLRAVDPEQPHLDSPAPLDPLEGDRGGHDSEPEQDRTERDEDYVGGEGEETGDDDWVDPQDEVDDEPHAGKKRRSDAGKATALWSDELDALLKRISRRLNIIQRNAGHDTAFLRAVPGRAGDGVELAQRDWDAFLGPDLFPETKPDATRIAFLKSKSAAQNSHVDKKPRLASPAPALPISPYPPQSDLPTQPLYAYQQYPQRLPNLPHPLSYQYSLSHYPLLPPPPAPAPPPPPPAAYHPQHPFFLSLVGFLAGSAPGRDHSPSAHALVDAGVTSTSALTDLLLLDGGSLEGFFELLSRRTRSGGMQLAWLKKVVRAARETVMGAM